MATTKRFLSSGPKERKFKNLLRKLESMEQIKIFKES
jgi:hypothetical protein